MSHLLRCGLVAAGLVGAFAAGFFLKPVPTARTVAAQTAPASHTVAKPPAAVQVPAVELPEVPPTRDPQVKPASALGAPQPARAEPVDPLEAAGMEMIRKEMGIKTTVLDKAEPVPAVLVDARKQAVPVLPQVELPPAPMPIPMGGPMPRLDPPPPPEIPTIHDPVRPPLPAIEVGAPKLPTLVNSRAVALDFEVTKTGASKVTAVELWTTRDGGATWAKTDRMAGARSPFRTRLGSEGEYGFRLVFESESGMRSPEPKRGDKPDLRVELDTTPPHIVLFPPESVPGHAGTVRLRWSMHDLHLDAWFARVEYSADGRTWQAVSAKVEPVPGGQYHCDWALPPGAPPRVLIRVTGRDGAGNSATASTLDTVVIDLVPPAGKVTGVRAIESEVGPAPREVEATADPVRPIPEALRSLLPALLASPSLYPPLVALTGGQPTPWDVSGNFDDPPPEHRRFPAGRWNMAGAPEPMSAREWVEWLTDTTVVLDPPLQPFRRPDPFAEPVVRFDALPTRVADPEEEYKQWVSPPRYAVGGTVVSGLRRRSGEQRRPFLETAGYTGGRSLIHHLADSDWKPSTATAESCAWEYDPAPTNFWGTPPLGIRFRF